MALGDGFCGAVSWAFDPGWYEVAPLALGDGMDEMDGMDKRRTTILVVENHNDEQDKQDE